MGIYDNYEMNNNNRQRDLVLSINEFCFVQNETNGTIKTHVGPLTLTVSQQESLVTFNEKTKKFEKTSDFEQAKQLFISAPEGWYVTLKNPAVDDFHPEASKANPSKELDIGTKVNIQGPTSFALYPGQMTKVVRGHRLRSNQYLLARVYDAQAAEMNIASATIVDAEGKSSVQKTEKYFMGQLLVIKGTEVSFYVPPTGIEVIPVGGKGGKYVREAITLERLEYAILKDEDGEKRYVHGPAVVFPKPTETFVLSRKDSYIFRALELSPISGIYVKVIAAYDDEQDGKVVHHNIGEELFITGNDQMIYYPRPEHAIIQYDGKYMHHAIAIPNGEGRYIMNRLTGEIKTVKGPQMYLPDPRVEVVVKRKLSEKECKLIYPGNEEVLEYNRLINEKAVEKLAKKGILSPELAYATSSQEKSLAIFEANANISRGTSYTKPRTITLDTKYDGVVSVNVWSGYAVNVVKKTGEREVIAGPSMRMLDYDETLETTIECLNENRTQETVYLKTKNQNIFVDIPCISKDNCVLSINLSLTVDYDLDKKSDWFSINNTPKYLEQYLTPIFENAVKKYEIRDFYDNFTDIINEIMQDHLNGYSNGLVINHISSNVILPKNIRDMISQNEFEIINNGFMLDSKRRKMASEKELHEIRLTEMALEADREKARVESQNALETLKAERAAEIAKLNDEYEKERQEYEKEIQAILNEIAEMKRVRYEADEKSRIALRDAERKNTLAIEKEKNQSYAETVSAVITSISPDLTAALTAKANEGLLMEATKNMSAYSIANGESVAETVNTLMRGTTLEGMMNNMKNNKTEKLSK